MNNKKAIIDIQNVTKCYHRGSESVHAVDGISLTINEGDYCSIFGPSGSGKTTLMNLIGCIDRPTSGKIFINGNQVQDYPDKKLTTIRQKTIGFVFQQFFLIPTLTVLENVELPCLFAKTKYHNRAIELLHQVGLGSRLDHLPNQLSGGEMQRVAIARSLINNPSIILADEPTGNLDSKNADAIIDIFDKLNQEGVTIILVSHNPQLVNHCDKIVSIKDGKINN